MYRRLPPDPSLDHLKNQAKDLLRELRAGEPEALERAVAHLPKRKQGDTPTLADAQFVIAREYYCGSWAKLKQHVEKLQEEREWVESHTDECDRLEVGIASSMLLGAMQTPIPQFSLRREADRLIMAQPDGYVCDVIEWLPGCPNGERYTRLDTPFAVEAVWERFLVLADLSDPAAKSGTIHIHCNDIFPYTDWTISVTRDGPDKLDFSLSLDRVDTTMPIWP